METTGTKRELQNQAAPSSASPSILTTPSKRFSPIWNNGLLFCIEAQ